ncbi:MFS transporter [Archangium sp.]|uniref:MFS transporter n=1 Tax=Archangium sp. TaxID=1872627 RepID=UPI002D711F0B|nr:MFS transporter [Archangium sp.]HYO53339.1 MFS transporter [Archangium sp.]
MSLKDGTVATPQAGASQGVSYRIVVVSAAVFLVTCAVNLEMPLYRTYARAAGHGDGLTALVFAAYVAGLLPTLLLLGGISDRIGRKAALLIGLFFAITATSVVIVSPTLRTLFLARVCQGIGVGLSVGAGTAYLAELAGSAEGAARAASYVAVTTALGFGGGSLFTGTVLLFTQSRVPISYGVVLSCTVLTALLVSFLPPQQAKGGALLRLPHFPPHTFAINASIVLAWAVTGVVISLLPSQLAQRQLSGWGGHALFLVTGTGALFQPLARKMVPHKAIQLGFLLVPLGYGILVGGAWLGILWMVLLGASIAGSACYGFTYLGGLAEISKAGGESRARAVSGYFLFAYLGFGLPSIVVGFLSDRYGIFNSLVGFGGFIALASLVLGLSLRPART